MGSVINMYPKCADWAWSGVRKQEWTCSWRKGSTVVPFFESSWIYSEGCVIFYNLLHVPSIYPVYLVVEVDGATPKGWLSKGPWYTNTWELRYLLFFYIFPQNDSALSSNPPWYAYVTWIFFTWGSLVQVGGRLVVGQPFWLKPFLQTWANQPDGSDTSSAV